MFSSIQSFVSRHRRKFLFGSVFIGGAFFLSKYANKALREHQERETKELFERNKKQQHYEAIEKLCNQTALNIITTLRTAIVNELNTEELINKLRGKVKVTDKVAYWEQLKILSFSRMIVLIYAASMLMVTLRIQLNLIGGYAFRGLVDDIKTFTESTQTKYLSLCDYFFQKGIKNLCELIKEKVLLFLKAKSLMAEMKVNDIETIFSLVQASIDEDYRNPSKTMSEYFLLEQYRDESFSSDNKAFDQVIRDTKDLFESQEVSYSVNYCVDRGKTILMENLKEFFKAKTKSTLTDNESKELVKSTGTSGKEASSNMNSFNHDEAYVDYSKISIQMAKVIPIVNALIQTAKNDMTEKWMLELIVMDRLKVMGANVYEAFSFKFDDV